MRNEEIGTDNGRAWIEPAGFITAGGRRVWRIVYEAGPAGIRTGGSVRFEFPYGFPLPQWRSLSAEGYIRVTCSRPDVKLALSYDIPTPKADEGFFYVTRWGEMVYVKVIEGELAEGDQIIITYGREFHCTVPGVPAQSFAQLVEFTVATDVDGTRSAKFSGYTLVAEQPVVEVVGGWPEVLRVFAPTIAGVGEDVCLKIVARDCYENTALVQPEMLELDGGPAVRAEVLPPKGPLMATRQAEGRSSARALDSFSGPGDVPLPTRTLPAVPRLASVRAAFPGTYRVEVAAPEMGLTGLSNPMVIEDRSDGLQLYWGDPHGHTRLSDGLGTPEAYFAFARDEAALDFAAIADHAQYMSDEDWEWIRSAVAAFNRPGEFVTILGYEYSLNADKPHFGDKCIYYPGENGPLLRETDIYRTEYADMAAHAVEWKRHGAMMVLHQHARGTCSFYDPDLVRLVEVYSVWGASEGPEATRDLLPSRVRDYSGHWARDALELGWILGFCAGSDDHAGRPGASNWLRRSEAWPGGLTAVWATELTREAIWDALWNRRCYGTTGARIFLEFTAAGHPMGSVLTGSELGFSGANVSSASACIPMYVRVAGTAPIHRLEILRDGRVVHSRSGNSWDLAFGFEDACLPGTHYWYVRVWQADGEMAWSSPIWVTLAQ